MKITKIHLNQITKKNLKMIKEMFSQEKFISILRDKELFDNLN